MREAARGGRRFGVATVTPNLATMIDDYAAALGLGRYYTGIRLTDGEPTALAADPERLLEELHRAVARCIREDGAEAVVIGGGPLGDAAAALTNQFHLPVIAPIPAAVASLVAQCHRNAGPGQTALIASTDPVFAAAAAAGDGGGSALRPLISSPASRGRREQVGDAASEIIATTRKAAL